MKTNAEQLHADGVRAGVHWSRILDVATSSSALTQWKLCGFRHHVYVQFHEHDDQSASPTKTYVSAAGTPLV